MGKEVRGSSEMEGSPARLIYLPALPKMQDWPVVARFPMGEICREAKKMLLCIDDSPVILEYEKRMFEQSGYVVVTEESARRGLQLATMYSFDAVLLDYSMPEMNGHDLAFEIRRLRPDTPVVMVSGSEIPDETRRLVDAVVPKEEANRELLPTIARLCDRA